MITVILNGYKRGDNLNEQLEALKNQTVKPDEILLWYNNPGDNDDDSQLKKMRRHQMISSLCRDRKRREP